MSRDKPPLPIGGHGKVDLPERRPAAWKACVRVHDVTGERSEVRRVSPDKLHSKGPTVAICPIMLSMK